MSNSNKTQQKIINLIQLRLSILLFNEQILELKKSIDKNKITKEEIEKFKNILELLNYINVNIENGIINEKFVFSNNDIDSLKKEFATYLMFVNDKKTSEKAELLILQVLKFKKNEKQELSFDNGIKIFDGYIKSRISKQVISDIYTFNLVDCLKPNYIELIFKYITKENQQNFFNSLILNCDISKIENILKKLINDYQYLKQIKFLDYQLDTLIKRIKLEELEILNKLEIFDIKKYNTKDLLRIALDKKRYDVWLWIYEFKNEENTFEVLKMILESSPFEDKVQICDLVLRFIKKSNFETLTKENIDYIKEILMQEDFGRNYIDHFFIEEEYDDKTELLRSAHSFLDICLNNDYIVDKQSEIEAEDLFIAIDEKLEYEDMRQYDYNLMKHDLNNIESQLVIDKIKFVEEFMCLLIDKTPSHLHNYLLNTYEEIMNNDNTIQQQKLIKTLTKILNKNNKVIE